MSADSRRRHDLGTPGSPDASITNRAASSASMLAERVVRVGEAFRNLDEPALRAELNALADEAGLLAKMDPLLPSLLSNRQMIAAEFDGRGRLS